MNFNLLSDWYFCCCTRLSPNQAYIYLTILDMLDDPFGTDTNKEISDDPKPIDQTIALEQLLKADDWLKTYAFPQVLFAALRYPEAFEGKKWKKLLKFFDKVVEGLMADAQRKEQISRLIRTVLDGRNEADAPLHLLDLVQTLRPQPQQKSESKPYLNLNTCKEEMVLLAIANALTEEDLVPENWQNRLQNAYKDQTKFFADLIDNAVTNHFGRLALRIGVILKQKLDDGWEARNFLLDSKVSVAPLHEPDLVQAYLDTYFERCIDEFQPKGDRSPDEGFDHETEYIDDMLNERFRSEFFGLTEYVIVQNMLPATRPADALEMVDRLGCIPGVLQEEDYKVRKMRDSLATVLPAIFWQYQVLARISRIRPDLVVEWYAPTVRWLDQSDLKNTIVETHSSLVNSNRLKLQAKTYEDLIGLHSQHLKVRLQGKPEAVPQTEADRALALIHSPILPLNRAAIGTGRRNKMLKINTIRYHNVENAGALIRLWAATYAAKSLLRHCQPGQSAHKANLLALVALSNDVKQYYRNWFYEAEELLQQSYGELRELKNLLQQRKRINSILSYEMSGLGLFLSHIVTTYGKGLGNGVRPSDFMALLDVSTQMEPEFASIRDLFTGIVLPEIYLDWVQDAFEGAFNEEKPQFQWLDNLTGLYDNHYQINRNLHDSNNRMHTDVLIRSLTGRRNFPDQKHQVESQQIITTERKDKLHHRRLLLFQPGMDYWLDARRWLGQDSQGHGIDHESYDIYRLIRATALLTLGGEVYQEEFIQAINAVKDPERLDRFVRLRLIELLEEPVLAKLPDVQHRIISLLLEFGGNYSFKKLFDKVFALTPEGKMEAAPEWLDARIHLLRGMELLAAANLDESKSLDSNIREPIDIYDHREKVESVKRCLQLVAYALFRYRSADNTPMLEAYKTIFENTEAETYKAGAYENKSYPIMESELGRKLEAQKPLPRNKIEAITYNPNDFTANVFTKRLDLKVMYLECDNWARYEALPGEVKETGENGYWLINYSVFHLPQTRRNYAYKVLARKEKDLWEPYYWYLERLLIDEVLNGDGAHGISLCYIQYKARNDSFWFTTTPGKVYQIYRHEFMPEALDLLQRHTIDWGAIPFNTESSFSSHTPQGTLLVFNPVKDRDGVIKLGLPAAENGAAPAPDRRNIEWRQNVYSIKRATLRNDNSWAAELPEKVEGFPAELEVKLSNQHTSTRETLTIKPGNPFPALFTGRLDAEAVSASQKLIIPENKLELFHAKFLQVAANDLLQLNRVERGAFPFTSCSTPEGIQVEIYTDGLFLSPFKSFDSLKAKGLGNQPCLVTAVDTTVVNESVLPDTEQHRIKGLLSSNQTPLTTVVFEIHKDLDIVVLADIDGLLKQLSFNLGNHPIYKQLMPGDILELSRENETFRLRVLRKRIMARALWELHHHEFLIGEENSQRRYLAKLAPEIIPQQSWADGPEYSDLLLVGDRKLAFTGKAPAGLAHLALMKPSAGQWIAEKNEALSAWELNLRTAKQGSDLFAILQNKESLIAGMIDPEKWDADMKILHAIDFALEAAPAATPEGAPLYLVRRTFHLTYPVRKENSRPGRGSQEQKKQYSERLNDQGTQNDLKRFQEFWGKDRYKREPQPALITGRGRKAVLQQIKVPFSLNQYERYHRVDDWRDDILIPDNEYLFIPFAYNQYNGARKGDNPARVQIFELTSGNQKSFRASLRQVQPFTLEEYARLLQSAEKSGKQDLNPNLFFVDYFDPQRGKKFQYRPDPFAERWLLFEFGFGKTLAVPESQIRFRGRPLRMESFLFYGDSIKRIKIQPDKDHKDYLVMEIERTVSSSGTGLYQQAKDHNLVHVVHVDPKTGKPLKSDGISASKPEATASFIVSNARFRVEDEQFLQNYLAALEDTVTELLVYAEIDQKIFEDSRGKELVFKVVNLSFEPQAGAFEPIKPGKLFFLKAGDIIRENNTYYLEAHSLTNVRNQGKSPEQYRISWRNFSAKLDYLKALYEQQGPSADTEGCQALSGQLIVVYAEKDDDGGIKPILLNAIIPNFNEGEFPMPTRPAIVLSGLLGKMKNPTLFGAVVGKYNHGQNSKGRPYVVVEIKPGLYVRLFREEVENYEGINSRDVVRIELAPPAKETTDPKEQKHQKEQFVLHPAVYGFSHYFPQGKDATRPVLLLPKDNLMSIHGKGLEELTTSRFWKEQQLFTVADFPEMQPFNNSFLPASRYLWALHEYIRVAQVGKEWKQFTISFPEKDKPANYAVGYIHLNDADHHPEIMLLTKKNPLRIDWTQLSFADTSASNIAKTLKNEHWTYHDSRTRRLSFRPVGTGKERKFEQLKWDRYEEIRSIDYRNTPLFFEERPGEKPSLRFSPKQFEFFGYDANALFQSLGNQRNKTRNYTVAGLCKNMAQAPGIWLEIMPGRISQALAPLFLTPEKISLRQMYWQGFGPGDVVALELVSVSPDTPHIKGLNILDWSPSPRRSFGPAGLVKVVRLDTQNGAMQVGAGRFNLTLPTIPPEVNAGDVLILRANNHLEKFGAFPEDTVLSALLRLDESGAIRIDGLEDYETTPSQEAGDHCFEPFLGEPGPAREEQIRHLIRIAGAVPVTIELVDRANRRITYSRRTQLANCRYQPGDISIAKVIGFDASGCILLNGAALIRLDIDQLVHGLPADLCLSALEQFLAKKIPVFLQYNTQGWEVGIALETQSAIGAQSLFFLRDPSSAQYGGMVIEDREAKKFYYVAAEEISWVDFKALPEADFAEKFIKLLKHDVLPVRIDHLADSVRASLVRREEAAREYRAMAYGKKIKVEILLCFTQNEKHKALYLARSTESGTLFLCHGPKGIANGPRLAIIFRKANKGKQQIIEAILGEVKYQFDLPPMRFDSAFQFNLLAEWSEINGLSPETLKEYWEETPDNQLAQLATERTLMLATLRLLQQKAHLQPDLQDRIARYWSKVADGMLYARYLNFSEALVMILIGLKLEASLPPDAPVRPALQNMVLHLIQNIANRAVRSLHIDILVNFWLADSSKCDKKTAPNLWARLFYIGEELFRHTSVHDDTFYGHEFITKVETFASKTVHLQQGSPEIKNVGLALQASLGDNKVPDGLIHNARVLTPVIKLANHLLENVEAPVETQFGALKKDFFEDWFLKMENKLIPDIILMDNLFPEPSNRP